MLVINETSILIDTIDTKKFQNKTIGFVPTMGALHDGHIELIRAAKLECDIIICSIYINPTQFNNVTDLEKYPRTLDDDINLLEKNGCDIAFCPSDKEMFKMGNTLTIDFGEIGKVLEGEFRPGHFSGVGLIVGKFFNIIKPNISYFGQKDLQQFSIVKSLVQNLNFNIQLRCIPTVRSKDGLALSSRNARLSKNGKEEALVFYDSLVLAKQKLLKGETVDDITKEIKSKFNSDIVKLEYFEIVHQDTFEKINTFNNPENIAICIAGYVEGIRLIDNILLS